MVWSSLFTYIELPNNRQRRRSSINYQSTSHPWLMKKPWVSTNGERSVGFSGENHSPFTTAPFSPFKHNTGLPGLAYRPPDLVHPVGIGWICRSVTYLDA